MANILLRDKQVEFLSNYFEEFQNERENLYSLRDQFTKRFSIDRLIDLPIDKYVIGKGEKTFCKLLERDLDKLGSIKNSPASKFGVYYGKEKPDNNKEYRFKPKWGDNYTNAYSNVKTSIIKLLNDGLSENFDSIVSNPISPMFKGKILSIYYPQRFLSIFSDDHLNHFLRVFNLDTVQNIKSDPVIKREILLRFKETDNVFKDWRIDMFTYFLYNIYPLKPVKIVESSYLESVKELLPLKYEIAPIAQNIVMEINALNEKTPNSSKEKITNKHVDYLEKGKRDSEVGARGEKVVLDYEIQKFGNKGLSSLANAIKQVSDESNSYGYDILSYNIDDHKEKYIEVKTTTGKPGETVFYLSQNELNKAKSLDNYWIYIVYDIQSKHPNVWEVGNLFSPENPDIKIEPTNYKVMINAKIVE